MKILVLFISLTALAGCVSGTGFNKKATLMPDEFSVSVDSNPQDDWRVDEVTGGLKWKLK